MAVLSVAAEIAACTGGTPAGGPQPAGVTPSSISRQVCSKEASGDLARVLHTRASVSTPTWAGHLYSCGYRYRVGTVVLSVKELSSWPQTYAYVGKLATTLHKTRNIPGLGQGAFEVRDGSVVVRKDWKVLLVNVATLHDDIGSPPGSPGQTALVFAAVILGCWAGD
jgi:hypothetical protein